MKEDSIAKALITPSPRVVLLFYDATHSVNILGSKKKLTSSVNFKTGNRIALLVHRAVTAWTTVREEEI